jgi:hypothetical protein
MNVSAKIIEVFETTQVTDSFKKREFVVEYAENPTYPEYVKFELIQDKCDVLNDYNPGDEVDIQFNLKGRKWTDPQGVVKYFNTLQAWKLEKKSVGVETPSSSSEMPGEAPQWLAEKDDDTNNLPF